MTSPDWKLHHDAWGRLVLTDAQGRQLVGVEPIRAFPVTAPRRWIAICDVDGTELVWIDSLDDLPSPMRLIIEDELSKRHFLPIINRIFAIEGRIEPTSWQVETDRGATDFRLKMAEDVRRVAGSRVLIVDSDGIRYLIPDLGKLDAKSRRLLTRYVT